MIEDLNTDDFTLVLSGGGALGIAHLGVIHDLEAKQIVPQEIAGTSMGGIIGACISIGMQEADIYEEIKAFSGLATWIKFSFGGNAIMDSTKIISTVERLFGQRKMKDTNISLKLIATNLHNGHKRVFTADDDIYIKDAVLATMAIPGIFDERVIENETYGDGFLCENLGVNEATCEDILAIDVIGKNSFQKELPDNFFKTANVMEMFEKSIRLIIYNQSQTHIKNSAKHIVLIEPDTKAYNTYHFHKHKEIRQLGLGLL